MPFVPASPVATELPPTDAIALVESTLVNSPEEGASLVGVVPELTPLRLAARGIACVAVSEDRCSERWKLAGVDAWIDGARLAVIDRLAAPGSTSTGLTGAPVSADKSAVPDFVWYGVTTAWEWTPAEGRDRVDAQGWIVVQSGSGLKVAELGRWSGWGSAEEVTRSRWIDLDGDRRAELLTLLTTSITEVGYGGLVVRVLGADLETKVDQAVGDPRVDGLGQGSFGTMRLEGATLVRDALDVVECPAGTPAPGQGRATCFTATRTTWAGLKPTREPLALPGGVIGWAHEEGAAATGPGPYTVLTQKGGKLKWQKAPSDLPAWAAAVFAGEREGVEWVTGW